MTCPRISILLLLLFLFGKATALPQRNMSEFSVDPSLKYPYPAQWLFKIFVFKACLRYGTKQLLSQRDRS